MTKLDILSDPICPWCYIGKANLDNALADHQDHPFTIEWHPFQLNPDMPPAGMNRREYLEKKFGGKNQAIQVYSKIEQNASAIGLPIDFAAMERTPNTIDAHRLIHWAGLEDKQQLMVDALFNAYFCMGLDIGDHNVLCDVAEVIGLERSVMARLLDSNSDVTLIKDRDAHSRLMGVSAVPTFIVGNQHAIPGAQTPDVWESLISELNGQSAD
ncbi:MAG: DsbA family oxidoreductase [Planktomarina sp.]|nr:DsbA family oxidoreductase [Planktomarina sp.]